MELKPVVEVVKVNGAGVDGIFVRDPAGDEDAPPSVVIMDVAEDRLVVPVERGFVELHVGLRLYPGFELGIGWFVIDDELPDGVGLEAERGDRHRIVASTDVGIARVKFAGGLKENFLPQSGEVKNAQRTGSAGADERNVGLAHTYFFD